MRYVVVFILFAIVLYIVPVATAILIGRDSWVTIVLSLLVGAVAGGTVITVGLKGKIHG